MESKSFVDVEDGVDGVQRFDLAVELLQHVVAAMASYGWLGPTVG